MDLISSTPQTLIGYSQSQAVIDRARSEIESVKTHSDKISPETMEKIDKVAKQYESVFVSQMLSHMMKDVGKGGMFHGGQTEDIFSGMLVEEYGKSISQQGGIGLSDHIKSELIRIQETQQ